MNVYRYMDSCTSNYLTKFYVTKKLKKSYHDFICANRVSKSRQIVSVINSPSHMGIERYSICCVVVSQCYSILLEIFKWKFSYGLAGFQIIGLK